MMAKIFKNLIACIGWPDSQRLESDEFDKGHAQVLRASISAPGKCSFNEDMD